MNILSLALALWLLPVPAAAQGGGSVTLLEGSLRVIRGVNVLKGAEGMPRGRSGRALTAWLTRDAGKETSGPTVWRRIPVTRGVELHVDADHPLARLGSDDHGLAETVRQAISKLLPHST